jgi:hypothetical protein
MAETSSTRRLGGRICWGQLLPRISYFKTCIFFFSLLIITITIIVFRTEFSLFSLFRDSKHLTNHSKARPVSTFLRAHLLSCNKTLQREECDAVALKSGSRSCVLGRRSYSAGLGHQMSEVLMWFRYAHLENASHLHELFGPTVTEEHGHSYEWANTFFGLDRAVHSMRGIAVDSIDKTNLTQHCDDIKRPAWGKCGTAASDGSCFESPRMMKLFASYAPCLRQSALCFGDWVTQAQDVPFDSAAVNVAWHIRVGSGGYYYTTSSNFYGEVLGFMAPFLRSRKTIHYLIGGSGWERENSDYVSHFQSIVSNMGLSTLWKVVPLFLSVKDSLLYMMSADILVSSSSSFTNIAALFSAFPVVINPPPKHGISANMFEYLPDGVYVDGWTWKSNKNYITNTYRPAGVSPSQTVNDTLHQRLASRFAETT